MTSSGNFKTTRWTVIRAARAKGEPGSAEALAGLCEAYWYPLYVFVRRTGHTADDARDLTQGYFLKLLEKDYLNDVRPEAGKFRSFLLASMKHFMANTRRDAAALKRGGGQTSVSLDLQGAEDRYSHETSDGETPERAYERQWARAVIDRVHERLREEFVAAGKLRNFEFFSAHLTGGTDARPYAEIAKQLGTSEAAIKMSVSRMRRQFGRALRDEIGDTIDGPEAIDDEIKYLFTVL